MVKSKTEKVVLDSYGSYLGMEKGCLVVRGKHGEVERYPLFESEIGEIQIKSGNTVSSGALATCGFWGIDCLFLTQRGRPVAMLKSLDDDSHVKTRVCQYEALKNGKGISIAKEIVLSRIESENLVLRKYGLRQHDLPALRKAIDGTNSGSVKTKLMAIEGHCSKQYFRQIFQLFPRFVRVENRKTFKAYDGLNNTFNLAYTVLKWKVHRALLRARLEPYLGFLHSEAWGKPSLVCDFMELYRYLVEDFLIQHGENFRKKDFTMKGEDFSKNKIAKREYLGDCQTHGLVKGLNQYFQSKVRIPRVRMGEQQEIETLINEEALLLAQFLRNERDSWIPRVVSS